MSESVMPLSVIGEGSLGRVAELDFTGAMRRRLLDMGLIPGARVECLQKSPSGDPVAYLIRGAVIALRREDSSRILINRC